MVRIQSWSIAAIAAAGLVGLPLCAAASAGDDKTVTEKVLDILKDEGSIDDAQYEELKKEAEEEKAAAQLPPVSSEDEWTAYYKDGTRIERKDGSVKIRIGGRIQFDGAVVGAEGAVVQRGDAFDDDDFENPEGTGVDFRRARLFVSGSMWDHLIFKAQYDFAGQDADFNDVWVGLQKIPGLGTIRLGHQKEPFSLAEQTSSKYITFLERSQPANAFSAGRNSGIRVQNTAFDKRLTWSVGGFRVVDNSGEDFSNQGNYNVGARVTGLPVWKDDGRELVHVGYSYRHEFADGEDREFGAKPEANQVDALIRTGDLLVDGVDVFNVEFAKVCGPFSFETEFFDALVDRDGMRGVNFWGVSSQASWFLTGEHRAYDQKAGAFGRTAPKRPFSLKNGDWGAFEIGARYSHLALNDEDVRGGIESNYTLGVNWYLYRNLRFMLNGVLAHVNGLGETYIGQARVAVDF